MKNIVISGTNRGIGLELCKHYLKQNAHVVALCRTASDELKELPVEIYESVDVENTESIQTFWKLFAKKSGEKKIDILINNAGILTEESLEDLSFEKIRRQFEINALGPLKLTQALLPALQAGSKIAMITSRMGSIGDNQSGKLYGYRMSKAALNMAAVNLAHDLNPKNIAVLIVHPGMVATEMTHGHGIAPQDAALAVMNRIDALGLNDSAKLWHANGELLPW